jgi:hypothetical protein
MICVYNTSIQSVNYSPQKETNAAYTTVAALSNI